MSCCCRPMARPGASRPARESPPPAPLPATPMTPASEPASAFELDTPPVLPSSDEGAQP